MQVFHEGDIAKNIKLIEWLKVELLDNVSTLFRGFVRGSESVLSDCLANIVISTYVLSRRLGVSIEDLDQQVVDKLQKSIETGHQSEEWYGDLTALKEYLIQKRR
ncbi:MAG: hypothetical protein JWN30_398 [Bacilli bacterium]|nr:hypothetical protein [Bacilli bacterium]